MKIKFKTSVEKIEISDGSPSFTTSVANFVLYFYTIVSISISASDPLSHASLTSLLLIINIVSSFSWLLSSLCYLSFDSFSVPACEPPALCCSAAGFPHVSSPVLSFCSSKLAQSTYFITTNML